MSDNSRVNELDCFFAVIVLGKSDVDLLAFS